MRQLVSLEIYLYCKFLSAVDSLFCKERGHGRLDHHSTWDNMASINLKVTQRLIHYFTTFILPRLWFNIAICRCNALTHGKYDNDILRNVNKMSNDPSEISIVTMVEMKRLKYLISGFRISRLYLPRAFAVDVAAWYIYTGSSPQKTWNFTR